MNKKIIKLADKFQDLLTHRTTENGQMIYFIDRGNKGDQATLSDIAYEINSRTSINADYCYEFLNDILRTIADAEEDCDLQDLAYELEPSPYTSSLTEWLHASPYHVYYLDKAIQEGGASDGFQALAMAQQFALQEAYTITLNELEKLT